MTDDDSQARLNALEADAALRNLTADYASAIDTHDIEAVRRVFAADAVVTAPGMRCEGIDDIAAFFDDVFSEPVARRHFITNVRITDTGEGTAAATSYFLFTEAWADESILGWGSYVDRAVESDGRWQFVEKDIVMKHRGPLKEGWAGSLAAEAPTPQ